MASRRLEIGFEGGTILRVTVEEDVIETLTGALGGEDFHSLEAEEGRFFLNLGELLYVRVVPGEAVPRIGFRD